MEPIKATTMQLGMPLTRKYIDMYWVSMDGRILHSNLRCRQIKQKNTCRRVPLYEDDGELHFDFNGYMRKPRMCPHCPEPQPGAWREEAACKNVDEDFFNPSLAKRSNLIATYCDNCPVQLECLEYGDAGEDNVSGIWGGVFFVKHWSRRKAAVGRKRTELLKERLTA